MRDLSPVERRLFDWLGHRSDSFLISLPMAVFLVIAVLGVVLVSVIVGRPAFSPEVNFLALSAVVAAVGLYLTTIVVMSVALIRTQRFRLLELYQSMRDIRAMSWREFEDLVAAVYVAKGYAVEPRGGNRSDGGVDLIVRKNSATWVVQCKHYRDSWVDVRPLRELLGVVSERRATGGIFVSCGVFDERALAFAKGTDKLELIGGEQLSELVQSVVQGKYPGFKCPVCGGAVREKTGRYGPFLSCTNFPACHGSLPIPS
ncbi:MAG: hypothetical protein AUJ02_04205 [Chloroflexi bacterium 13_1_40CM_3_65_12]|nr:MAG: hypothetical protein AUJ02_04205 [Chloroflexi bacterium 13_1_40CM_3_65_12]